MSRGTQTIALLLSLLVATGAAAANETIPDHPDELQFPALEFTLPKAEDHRHTLANGSVAYIVEDHTLPLFQVGVSLRIGSFLEPADKVGLASLTGRMMRLGGAGDLSGTAFDERAAFLAANLSAGIGSTSGSASVNCLSSQRDACLDLFVSMMRSPRFDAERMATEKSIRLEELSQRNDEPQQLASREWRWLLYGKEHFASRFVTGDSLAAIERDDLVAFHRSYWRPENFIWAISGDVDPKEMVAALNSRLAGWPSEGAKDVPWPPPQPKATPAAGVYVVEKDIPQGRVRIGSLTAMRDDWMSKEAMAASLMNDILGGSGFTARITKRIRSDEGLAYSAFSTFNLGNDWAGQFYVGYQSKSETVAFAAELAFEELNRIREELVSDQELTVAKGSLRDSFPQNFESAQSTAAIFARDDLLGRPHAYWSNYQRLVESVSAEDVRAAARRYLDPESMVFLVVGDWEAVAAGDSEGRASMEQFFDGVSSVLPARDPVSLEALP